MKIALVSGGFDPLHSGHIEYFKLASKLGDRLVVGINSDNWLVRKKGKPFLPMYDRLAIIQNLKMVSEVITFDDSDNSASDAIAKLLNLYQDDQIVFCNGGDRTICNTLELVRYNKHPRVSFKWGVGGFDKINSSSDLLDAWVYFMTSREK